MQVLTAAQMREADRRCIEELGIPGAVLMNNAGAAVFSEINRGPVGIVCGKGNNGGDGFVAARLALLAGLDTRVVLVARPEEISGDAATFMQVYRNLGGPLVTAPNEAAATAAMEGLPIARYSWMPCWAREPKAKCGDQSAPRLTPGPRSIRSPWICRRG